VKSIYNEEQFNKNKERIHGCLKPNIKNIEPRKIYDNIGELSTTINKIRTELGGLKGVYGFFCKMDKKLYVGSSKNLVYRFNEHLKKGKIILWKSDKCILKRFPINIGL
jgi:hypothetical protein